MRTAAALLLAGLLLAGCDAGTAPPTPAPATAPTVNATTAESGFPALTGRVVDEAELLSTEQEAELDGRSAALEQRTSDQLVIVTLRGLNGRVLADYARELGNHWGIGQRGRDNGVLLVVVPAERQVRIAVGRGLEPVLTEQITQEIIERDVLPHMRDSQYGAGITAGAEAIISRLVARADAPRQAP